MRATLAVFGVAILAVVIAIIAGWAFFAPSKPLAVVETDFRIRIPTTLSAGTHKITFENHGAQPHELLIFRTTLPAAKLPLDRNGDVVEDSPLLRKVLDSGAGLRPGGTQHLAVLLAPGHYAVVCDLPRHYGLGMHLDLTVTT